MRDRGVTIVLVTHLMEEAERLCDRVALIDHGTVIALDHPASLRENATRINRIRLRSPGPRGETILGGLPEVTQIERHGHDIIVHGSGDLLPAVVRALDRAGLTAQDLRTQAASLEDAFLALTDQPTHATTSAETTR